MLCSLGAIAPNGAKSGPNNMYVQVYNDKVFDLVNKREPCELKVDKYGRLQFRQATEVKKDGRVIMRSIESTVARSVDDIRNIMRDGLAFRSAGHSTLHSQSSRSHALFELEVVNDDILAVREALIMAEAVVVKWGFKYQGILMKYHEGGRWENKVEVPGWGDDPANQALLVEEERLAVKLEEAQREKDELSAKEEVIRTTTAGLGGSIVLVDLAGADYDTTGVKQTPQAMREFR